MQTQALRARRSVLYMPASNAKAIEKAKTINADCLIFDLEDAVAPEMKGDARVILLGALQTGGFGNRELIIRTNTIDSIWFDDDINLVLESKAHAVLIPKTSTVADIASVDTLICAKNRGVSIDLWAMVETPLAIVNLNDICAASNIFPLKALVVGTNDLAKETGASLDVMRAPFQYALSKCVIAARAYGLVVIDGVFNNIEDEAGFEKQCFQAKQFGFDGKTLIHPNQIEICNQIFSPSQEEIAAAKQIIAAFGLNENKGKAVISLNGQMFELLHLEAAIKTIAAAH